MASSLVMVTVAFVSIFLSVMYATRHDPKMALFALAVNVLPLTLVLASFLVRISFYDLFVSARVMELRPVVTYYGATICGVIAALVYSAYDDLSYEGVAMQKETSKDAG